MNLKLLTIALLSASTLATTAAQVQAEPHGTLLPRGSASPFNPTAEEAIAKQQIRDAGYGGVTSLMREPDGTWHAQAVKNDAYFDVTLDRGGHVTPR